MKASAGSRCYDAPVSEPYIRKVRPDDLEEVWRVHIAASNDLMVRRGRSAAPMRDLVTLAQRPVASGSWAASV